MKIKRPANAAASGENFESVGAPLFAVPVAEADEPVVDAAWVPEDPEDEAGSKVEVTTAEVGAMEIVAVPSSTSM
jgi:hypothetical protein